MDKANSKTIIARAISVTQKFFAITFILVVIFFICGQLFLPAERDKISEKFRPFNDGWEQLLPDGTLKQVDINNILDSTPGETVTIQTHLPDDLTGISCITIKSMWQDVNIYVGDELRLRYCTKDSRLFGVNSTMRYLFADISEADEGKPVRIETTSDTSYSGSFRDIYLGDTTSMWLYLLDKYGYLTIASLMLMIISFFCTIVCGIVFIVYRKPVALTYLALGVFLCAIWMFSENKFRQLIFSNASTMSAITFWSLMLLPFPFLFYINGLQNGRYKSAFATSAVFSSVVTVVVSLLQIFNIIDFRNNLSAIHTSIIFAIAVCCVTIIIDIKKGYIKEYMLVAVGFLGAVLGALGEIILFYTTPNTTLGTSLSIGLAFLLVIASFKAVNDFIRTENDKHKAIASNEAKARFLANMSHEIRTPINTIIGMNEMILRENNNDDIQEYARYIQSSSKMLLGLINDILDLSKIEAGQIEISEGVYNLSNLLLDELHLLEARAHKKNLKINLSIDENTPAELYGDEIRIKQIITNILTNAVKYTPKGTVTLNVAFNWIDTKNIMLKVSVTDTGIGIKPEDIDTIFESFKRVDILKTQSIEGTGLGLNITKQLVEHMNGSISVESIYGKGSTFTVKLPQKVIDSQKIGNLENVYKTARQQVNVTKEPFIAPTANILVVDDNAMNLAVIKGLLKRTKISIDTADGGQAAIEQSKNTKYDIIFMDHMMPGIDGITALNTIRNDFDNVNRNSVIIVLTANAVAGCHDMYISSGFDDYLSKPVESWMLEQTLIKYLPHDKVILTNYDDTDNKTAVDAANTINDTKTAEVEPERPTNIIDRESGISYCAGSEEFYESMLETYCNQCSEYKPQLQQLYKDKNWDEYRIIVHALKSNSLNIGAKNFSEESKKQEFAVKEDNINYILESFDEYLNNLSSLVETIEASLKK